MISQYSDSKNTNFVCEPDMTVTMENTSLYYLFINWLPGPY